MNVMVFTSEPAALGWLSLAITIRGHSSVHATHPDDALLRLTEAAYDLVVVDHIHSDERTCVDVCRQVREQPQSQAIPVWVLVTRDRLASAVVVIDAGATSILLHPVDAQQLRSRFEILEQLLGQITVARPLGAGVIEWLFDLIDHPIAIVDQIGVIRSVSPHVVQLTGISAQDLVGVNIEVLSHSDDIPLLLATIRSARVNPGSAATARVRIRGSAIDWQGVDIRAMDLQQVSSIEGIILMFRETIMREPRAQLLAFDPLVDPITRLASPELFGEYVALALARGERTNRAIAVIVVEIHGPRNDLINESAWSHIAGEVRKVIRTSDVATMLGRQTFAILADDIERVEDAAAVSTRVQAAINALMGSTSDLNDDAVMVETAISRPGITTREQIVSWMQQFVDDPSSRRNRPQWTVAVSLADIRGAVSPADEDDAHGASSQLPTAPTASAITDDEPTVEIGKQEPQEREPTQTAVQQSDVIDRFLALEAHLAELLDDETK